MSEYPTDEELKQVSEFDPIKDNIDEFLSFLESIWWIPDWGFKLKGKRIKYLELHTGGWSGNEDIIYELKKTFFWMWWRMTKVGGHYYFRIKPIKDK